MGSREIRVRKAQKSLRREPVLSLLPDLRRFRALIEPSGQALSLHIRQARRRSRYRLNSAAHLMR